VAEFQWWLLIVGIVAGGGLVAVVFMDSARRDVDLADEERSAEATWIAEALTAQGRSISADEAHAVLVAHHDYLALPPPDRLEPVEPIEPVEPADGIPPATVSPSAATESSTRTK
jgi:hypothetical protein